MWHDEYLKTEKKACYFITFNIVDWVDVFIRPVYKQVIVHSLNHFIDSKGLIVHSWCLMSNHLHLLIQAQEGAVIANLEKEFKQFTTNKILEAIETEPCARKDWMLKRFENSSILLGFKKKYQVWQTSSSPLYIDMKTNDEQLVDHFSFIHNNPVRDRCVDIAADYPYSSARDYAGMKGLVKISKPGSVEQQLAANESLNENFFVKYIRN